MPVMFFVSGSLFAASAGRRGGWRTVRDRVRRIGPSLWLFAAGAWLLMAVAARVTGTSLDWSHLTSWFVPVTDPVGSAWEGGWLSSPLWYLRTLLWILLLAPVLAWLVRRAPVALLVVGVLGVGVLEWVDRGLGWHPSFAPRLAWQAGDVVLFGLFFAFGMWTRSPGRDPAGRSTARQWGIAALVSGAVAVGVWVALPPPGGVVNDSHVVHLVVGATLLFAVLAAAGPIGRLAERPWLRPGVDLLGRRSLTVYLWHTAAIAGALWVLARLGLSAAGTGALAYALLIVAGVTALTLATGWVEDLAARRAPQLLPLTLPSSSGARRGRASVWRVPAAVGLAALVLVAAVGLPVVGGRAAAPSEAAFRPRVPSQAPPLPSIVSLSDEPEWWTRPVSIDPVALERTLADWAAGERRGRRLGRRHHP